MQTELREGEVIHICGKFTDQMGRVRIGRITGWNGLGVPCRKYTWLDPAVTALKGKTFEAFDDQILKFKVKEQGE